MRAGLQFGKHFFGYESAVKDIGAGSVTGPFTENVESGMPYRVAGTNIADLMALLNNEYTDRTLIELFGTMAEVYSPIDAIASRAITGVFNFKRIDTDEIIYGNPTLDKLLEQPNPFQNFQELLYEAICYELVLGNEFMLSNTATTLPRVDYKNVITTYNLPGDKITIKTPDSIKLFTAQKISDVVQGYILEKGGNNEQTFKTENVLHRKEVSLEWKDKKLKGRSRMLSAKRALANLIAVYEARGIVYIKRGAMGMWVSRKLDDSGTVALTDKEKKDAREELDKNYGITKGKHTVGMTGVPMDFVKSSFSIDELKPFDETKADASAVYAVYGVPDELMPGNDNGTYENKRVASIDVYRTRSIPITESWCQSLTNFWQLKPAGIYLSVDYSHIEILQENKKQKADTNSVNTKTLFQQFQTGAIPMNEYLAQMGYEPPTNALYKKLIYDMTPEELAKVKEVLSLVQKDNSIKLTQDAPPVN